MPLNESCSREALQQNIAELINAGHDRDQAVAIAYRVLEKACGGRPSWAQTRALLADDRKYRPGPIPKEVIKFLSGKSLKPGFSYLDVWKEEHAYAFTVAKVLEIDLLNTVKQSLAKSLTEGTPFEQWAKDIEPTLTKSGWASYGTEEQSPYRLRRIYETNMRTARAEGQYNRIQRTKSRRPYLQYTLGPSENHRPEHEVWDGLVLPADDPWWESHFGPLGFGCKCGVRQLSASEAQSLGVDEAPDDGTYEYTNPKTGDTEQIPVGVDPSFNYNKGSRGDELDDVLAESEL